MTEPLLLVLVVATALAFDFTNGFHDTGNAMATSIATRALKPKQAVLLSASLNLVGAFLSLTVAATIATGIIDANIVTLEVVLAGLVGGIVWNLITWLFGIPSSSSHALIGGVVGAALAAAGSQGVLWTGLTAKVLIPALVAPIVAILVGTIGTWLVARFTRDVEQEQNDKMFRWGQIGSASLVSLAHGTNDAQKSMGIILLALIAAGAVPQDSGVPFWVILSCALAMAIGTYTGGWRVIRTLGKGLVELESRQGMAAETSSAAVILLSSHFGYSLSTTHVATGSILGSGVGMKGASVRWSVAGRMFLAWMITVPAAALVGAACLWLDLLIGGTAGSYVVFGLLLVVSGGIFAWSRRKPVNHSNVNDDWDPAAESESFVAESVASHTPQAMTVKKKRLRKAKKALRKREQAEAAELAAYEAELAQSADADTSSASDVDPDSVGAPVVSKRKDEE
ncbi:inorganic phosphate transporter [Demequina sp. B12]|uniref:inorganic phosphate transporter n=1 Tax=Demequina sp. B12 TaxID=2992757 RepID=UPI00237A7D98|nr:inorganic phosphate transporter [Demequina sp. B12]MDE0572082.1 inorganic phosphate transporter [Demequina sp. B12]